MLALLVGGLVILGLLTWFYSLEIGGDRHTIFVVLAVVFLIEAVIAGGGADVPVGLLRPQFGGQDFRPPDVIIVAAAGAHLVAGRMTGRLGPLTFGWFPFVAVYLGGVAIGVLNGLPVELILFEGKTLFYLVGGAMIASGVDTERLMDSVGRVGVILAPAVPIALLMRTTGIELSLNTPVQRLSNLGALSNDTITIMVGLGAVVIVAECVRTTPSFLRIGAGVVLLLSPLAATQRASYLSLAATLGALVVFVSGRTWRSRSTVRPAQLALVTAGLTAVLLIGFLATDSPGVVTLVDDAFGGVGNEQSAEARTLLYSETIAEIREEPFVGFGLGAQVTTTVESGELTASPHNIVLDLMLRVGIIGLVAFLIGVIVTWAISVRVWRWAPSARTAAVGAAVVMVFAAVLGKALVEPALSKFRLSLLLGMALGCLAAAERIVDTVRTEARMAGVRSASSDGSEALDSQVGFSERGGNTWT